MSRRSARRAHHGRPRRRRRPGRLHQHGARRSPGGRRRGRSRRPDHGPGGRRRLRGQRRPRRPPARSRFSINNAGSKVTEFYLYGTGDRIMGEVENIGPGPHPPAHRRGARRRHLHHRLQARHGRRRHPRAVHRHRHGRPLGRRERQARRGHRRLQALRQLADRGAGAEDPGVRRRGQGAATSSRPRRCSRSRAPTGSGSSRWPSRSATSTRRSTAARTTSATRACSSPATTAWRRTCGSTGLQPDSRRDRRPADGRHQGPAVAGRRRSSCTPVQLANGAKELLDEVATGKITGEEDRYSHTDLWDFKANVEGSQAAVAALRPVIDEKDPTLGPMLDERFAAVDDAARELPGRRRLQALHRPDRGRHQEDDRGRRRAGRAGQPGRRRRHVVTVTTVDPTGGRAAALSARPGRVAPANRPTSRGRRRPEASPGAGCSAGPAPARRSPGVGAVAGYARRPAGRRTPRRRHGVVAVPRHAPGRDRHPGAGPAALRRARPDHHRPGRGQRTCCSAVDGGRRAHDRGRRRPRRAARSTCNPDAPPTDTGEALGLPAVVADAHLRRSARRSSTSSASPRARPAALADLPAFQRRPARPGAVRRRPLHPGLRQRPAGRRARGPQPRPHRLRDHGGALVAARVRAHVVDVDRSRPTPRNLFGFKDGTHNLKAEEPDLLRRARLGAARRRARPG